MKCNDCAYCSVEEDICLISYNPHQLEKFKPTDEYAKKCQSDYFVAMSPRAAKTRTLRNSKSWQQHFKYIDLDTTRPIRD